MFYIEPYRVNLPNISNDSLMRLVKFVVSKYLIAKYAVFFNFLAVLIQWRLIMSLYFKLQSYLEVKLSDL
jgi:hypothetical protein